MASEPQNQTPSSQTFHHFPRLAPELRAMIWSYACTFPTPRRIIHLQTSQTLISPPNTLSVPTSDPSSPDPEPRYKTRSQTKLEAERIAKMKTEADKNVYIQERLWTQYWTTHPFMATCSEARDKWLEMGGGDGGGGGVSCLRGEEEEGEEEEAEEEADEEEEEEEDEEEEWTVSKGNYLLRAMAKMMKPYPEPNNSDADSDVEESSTRSGRSTPSNSISSIAQRDITSSNEQPTPHFELIQASHDFLTPTHFNPDLDILYISSSPITPPSQSSSTPFLPHNTILDSLARWLSPNLIPQIRYLAMSQSTFRTLALQVEEVWEGMNWGDLGDMEERMGVMLGRDFEDLERLFVVADSGADSATGSEDQVELGGNCKGKGKGKGRVEEGREVDEDEVMKRAIEDVARLMARVRGKVPGFRVRSWTLVLEERSILRLVNGEGSSFGFRTVRR